MKNPCEPGSPSFPHPIGGPRAVWLLTKDRWSVTPSSAVPEQTTHCADDKGRVSPRALACRADGNAGGRTNRKWICGFRSQFKISILILSWNRFVYTGMHVRIFGLLSRTLGFFFSKVIWSYKINLQNNSNEWPKSEKDIFRLSFGLECTKKITNNSNSFSFCFYLLNYGMLRLLFGKKKNRVIFWSKFWTQAAFLRCVNTEEIATEILPPNFKLQRLQRATGRNIFPAFPTSALRSSSS